MINDNNLLINEYRGYIKNLEELNHTYTDLINALTKNNSEAELEVRQCIGTIMGKKVF